MMARPQVAVQCSNSGFSVSLRAPLFSMRCAQKMQTVPWETQWFMATVLGVLLKKPIKSLIPHVW